MIEARVTGLPDMRAALRSMVPKLRVRALRLALAAAARVVQKAARAATPVINPADMAVRRGIRKPGTVRQAIRVRSSRAARARGDVGVFVNVQPAKGAVYRTKTTRALGLTVRTRTLKRASQRGAKSPNDPFYWRWLAFGARHMRPFPILQRGAAALPQALAEFRAKLPAIIAKLNRPKAPTP